MKSGILTLSIFILYLYGCKTEEILLHGDIAGTVTDATTNEPLGAVKIKLASHGDSTATGDDGKYLLRNILPGSYDIQASKDDYGNEEEEIYVASAMTQTVNFTIEKIPKPELSVSWLDFSLDYDTLSFTIANTGVGELIYAFKPSQNWIKVYPSYGGITDELDTIKVIIDRKGLSINKYKENITLQFFGTQGLLPESGIDIYLNGIMDPVTNQYYKIIRIGTQVWMGENINTGNWLNFLNDQQKNNGITERYCILPTSQGDCGWAGGLYLWDEMMQYNPPDNKIIGTNQGICPVGWHIPTQQEWITMIDYLGGYGVAGGKLKRYELWEGTGAIRGTDEVGFTARPSMYAVYGENIKTGLWTHAYYWTASECNAIPARWCRYVVELRNTDNDIRINYVPEDYGSNYAYSVRCIKDPPKAK